MTRSEALLKLLARGGLSYESILETMGGSSAEVHEVVRELKKSGAIKLHKFGSMQTSVYEINPDKPEPKEAPKVQPMPSSEGNERALEPVQPTLRLVRGANDSANSEAANPNIGEIKAVICAACGLDSIRSRRGHAAGSCRHKNTCDSAVNPTKALEAAWFGI